MDIYKPNIIVLVELRVDAERLKRPVNRLGFDEFHYSNGRGFSGGIIVAWRSDTVEAVVTEIHFQFVHLSVKFQGGVEWRFAAVYANPNENQKRELWHELHRISVSDSGAWLVAGDLNDVIGQHECKGYPVNTTKARRFADRIDQCHLLDLGSIGSKFTWRGPRFNGVHVLKRLDRALCNEVWRLTFPEAVVKTLPRVDFSDHHPILILPYGVIGHFRNKPFRFERAWQSHSLYKNSINAAWNPTLDVVLNIQNAKLYLQNWGKEVFGDVSRRKRRLLSRIGGIQKAYANGNNNRFLRKLESSLQRDLKTLLAQEELMWYQRSWSKWLSDGDRNTRYYHLKTVNRRRRNNIVALRDGEGIWRDNESDVRSIVNEFYNDLFKEDHVFGPWDTSTYSFGMLTREELDSLDSMVDAQEVRHALFSLGAWKAPVGAWKAPGPDGFPPGFFQKDWDLVKEPLISFVSKVWENP